jgi:ribonuclease HI
MDATVSKNTDSGAVAAVARDDRGRFMGASTLIYLGRSDAETLEALACREGIALARDISARQVLLASDCLNVVCSLLQDPAEDMLMLLMRNVGLILKLIV